MPGAGRELVPVTVHPMLLAEAADKFDRPVPELLRRLDMGEIRAACIFYGADAPYWSWFDDSVSHEPVRDPSCEHLHIPRDGAPLDWKLVRRWVADLAFVRVVLEPGELFQTLNVATVQRWVGVRSSRLLETGGQQLVESATKVRAEVGIPIGLPSPLDLADGRSVNGLWCIMNHELALSDLYIVGEDLPKLTDDALTEAGRDGYLKRIGLLAKLLEATDPTFGTNEEPDATAIAKAACSGDQYSWTTLRDDINKGLRLLAKPPSDRVPARRKPGPKPIEEAKAGVVGKQAKPRKRRPPARPR